MGLIEAVIAAIVVAAISRLAADEFKAWLPCLQNVVLRQAVRSLPEDQRERYTEEWSSHIEEVPGEIGKLAVAISLLSAGYKLSRALPQPITPSAKAALSAVPEFEIGRPMRRMIVIPAGAGRQAAYLKSLSFAEKHQLLERLVRELAERDDLALAKVAEQIRDYLRD